MECWNEEWMTSQRSFVVGIGFSIHFLFQICFCSWDTCCDGSRRVWLWKYLGYGAEEGGEKGRAGLADYEGRWIDLVSQDVFEKL